MSWLDTLKKKVPKQGISGNPVGSHDTDPFLEKPKPEKEYGLYSTTVQQSNHLFHYSQEIRVNCIVRIKSRVGSYSSVEFLRVWGSTSVSIGDMEKVTGCLVLTSQIERMDRNDVEQILKGD